MEFLHYIDYIVFSILGFMGFLTIWLSIERTIFFSKLKFSDYSSIYGLEEALTKHMTSLYIIYSNAPYIGLLGTVGGIILTFYKMSEGAGLDARKIVGDLSLALEATGAGLLVAIPSLMIYNALLRKIDVLISRYKAINPNEN